MDKVKEMIEAGVSIRTAIREALGMNYAEFGRKHGIAHASVKLHLTGHVKPTEKTINALIAELGGTEDEWRWLLWEAGRPEKVAS